MKIFSEFFRKMIILINFSLFIHIFFVTHSYSQKKVKRCHAWYIALCLVRQLLPAPPCGSLAETGLPICHRCFANAQVSAPVAATRPMPIIPDYVSDDDDICIESDEGSDDADEGGDDDVTAVDSETIDQYVTGFSSASASKK